MIYILLVQWPHLGILPPLSLMCFPFEHFLPLFSSKSTGSSQVAATELCDMIDMLHRLVYLVLCMFSILRLLLF